MRKALIVVLGGLVAFALTTAAVAVTGHLGGEPREPASLLRFSGGITLVAFPVGMLLALLLLRRRNG